MDGLASKIVEIPDSSGISEQALLNRITNRIRESLELPEILSATVAEVRAYLGTDRVKIYQFQPDSHGLVVAEAINGENLPSLQGLHFPADDIPTYARHLYVTARQRTIVDVSQQSIGTSRLDCVNTGSALLDHDPVFRQVDPCHLEYLHAMGVKSSVVVPIVLEKPEAATQETPNLREPHQLWGLLVSHHAQPRNVSITELNFIQSVVDQVSIAISQSVLLEQMREQARREANVNRVTSLLYTSATVQLERALIETVAVYQGSGGRLCLFGENAQIKSQLYTYGSQPSPLPGSDERPVEEHALWQRFLASTLQSPTEAESISPWSVPWMKEKYSLEANADDSDPRVWAIADIYQEPLFRSLTPRFQATNIRGVMICPLHYGGGVVGCLTIFRDEVDQELIWAGYHNPDERQMTPRQSFDAWRQLTKGCAQAWNHAEIRLIYSLAERFAVAVKQYQLNQKVQALNTNLERQVEIRTRELHHSTMIAKQQRTLAGILAKLQKPLDMRTLFRTATQEMQQLLNVDRVAIYRFNVDWSGEFIAEFGAVSPGWAKIILATRSIWNDTYLQSTHGGRYQHNEISIVHDIYEANLSPCHIEVLEHYYVRAFLITPLFVGQRLWGLVAAYQHEKPRIWEDSEATFVSQLATHLGVALQQAESVDRVQTQAQTLALIADQQKALNAVITKIRESLDLSKIFKTTTFEMRRLLDADRVTVFRFFPETDYEKGEVISEDIRYGYPSILDIPISDACFAQNCKMGTTRQSIYSIDDVSLADIAPCYQSMLQGFNIQASLVAPLYNGEELWGLLCIHQCSGPRQWQPQEKEFATQIADQLGVALQQAKLLLEAEEARETADAANHAKSKFLANMSHELRTPLNAILGLVQLLCRDAALTEKQKKHLGIIGQSGEHLLLLINDVLEMSRIEAGQAKLERNVINLPAFLNSLQDMLEVTAILKKLELRFEVADNIPDYILVDEAKLRQILINLLGNALKFTQKGEVVLEVSATKKISNTSKNSESRPSFEIHFVVNDSGPGIPAEDIDHIFEAFAQSSSSSQSHEGNGLGLAICRQFIVLMGGDIFVSSEVGVGSTFNFFIDTECADKPDISEVLQAKDIFGLAPDQVIPKILVVEDKDVNQTLLVDFLKTIGFEVNVASNGQEAINVWQEWSPDFIWMDMRMPIMDGYIATREIKRLAGNNPPVIVALTANAFEEDRLVAIEYGCDDFVRKPYQEHELLDTMTKYLGVRYLYKNQTPAMLESSSLSVLVAEDNLHNQTMVQEMLSYLGHTATIVSNGQEAIAALQAATFDIVLLDVHMPEMNGLDATRHIRQTFPHPQPVIVGATGSTTPEELALCLEVGMDQTLIKPFSLEALKALLASLPEMQAVRQVNNQNQLAIEPAIDSAELKSGVLPAILDMQYLQDYHEIFGDFASQKIADYLRVFLVKMPDSIAAIQDAIKICDREAIFQLVHGFRPSVSYVGGTELSTVCALLEESSKQESWSCDQALLDQFIWESHRLELALEQEIADLESLLAPGVAIDVPMQTAMCEMN